jgi:hypothetical protein
MGAVRRVRPRRLADHGQGDGIPYGSDAVCDDAGKHADQWCYDAIRFRPLGAIDQPLIGWVSRPTYQQVVEVQGPRPG